MDDTQNASCLQEEILVPLQASVNDPVMVDFKVDPNTVLAFASAQHEILLQLDDLRQRQLQASDDDKKLDDLLVASSDNPCLHDFEDPSRTSSAFEMRITQFEKEIPKFRQSVHEIALQLYIFGVFRVDLIYTEIKFM